MVAGARNHLDLHLRLLTSAALLSCSLLFKWRQKGEICAPDDNLMAAGQSTWEVI
jgi:hypothetical protein